MDAAGTILADRTIMAMGAPCFVDATLLNELLTVEEAIDALDAAFAVGLPSAPERTNLPIDGGELLVMPSYGDVGVGVKLVTICPGNSGRGLPTLGGVFALFAPSNLGLEVIIDGPALTSLRTSAVSGLATRYLARADATRLVLFGAGVQAHAHLAAMCAVRPIQRLTVIDPRPERAQALVDAALGRGIDAGIGDPDAVGDADIVCTCTTSSTPVFDGEQVASGAHVNAMGSYRADARELDSELLSTARVTVEQRSAALSEAGDLLIPIGEGTFQASDIVADLAEVILGAPVRRTPSDITVFKSVGLASEDLVVATAAWSRSVEPAKR